MALRGCVPDVRSSHIYMCLREACTFPEDARCSPQGRPGRTVRTLLCSASSGRSGCRTLRTEVYRLVQDASGDRLPMYRKPMPATPASCISLARETSRNALSFGQVSQEAHHRGGISFTFPRECFSHSFSYMKYTLDTHLGRMSMMPIAMSFPSTLYSW